MVLQGFLKATPQSQQPTAERAPEKRPPADGDENSSPTKRLRLQSDSFVGQPVAASTPTSSGAASSRPAIRLLCSAATAVVDESTTNGTDATRAVFDEIPEETPTMAVFEALRASERQVDGAQHESQAGDAQLAPQEDHQDEGDPAESALVEHGGREAGGVVPNGEDNAETGTGGGITR